LRFEGWLIVFLVFFKPSVNTTIFSVLAKDLGLNSDLKTANSFEAGLSFFFFKLFQKNNEMAQYSNRVFLNKNDF